MTIRSTLAGLAAATVLAAGPAAAHDIWMTLSSGQVVPQVHVHYGHPDDLQMPQADKLVDLSATDAAGTRALAPKLQPSRTAPVLVSEPVPGLGAAMLAARYDNGFWVKAPDGEYRNTTRRMVPNAGEAITSVKFAKLLAGPGAPWAAPVGHELEIVPVDDPMSVKAGGMLRVKVLFRGEPVANAAVVRSDGETVIAQDRLPTFRSDAAGIAAIPIEKAGGEVLSVTRRVSPSAVPALADADTFSATLAFTLDQPRTN